MKTSACSFASTLLTGGQSTRMGRDKALIEIEGEPLWLRQLRLLGSVSRPVSVSSRRCPDWTPVGIAWVPDVEGVQGPLAGLLASLAWARQKSASHLIALAVDLPCMDAPVLHGLLSVCSRGRGAVPRMGDGFEPLAAVYPVEAESILRWAARAREWKLQNLIVALLERGIMSHVEVSDPTRFHNMNTPADLPG